MENKKTIIAIRDFIISAEKSIKNAKKLLKDVLEENNLDLNSEINLDTKWLNNYSSENSKIIEGVFTWEEMLWSDWNKYPVPANYSSKSKLVQWDKLKLTIDPEMMDNLQIPEIANWKSKLEGTILEWYKWDQDEDPEIIEKAIQIVKDSKKWSTSLIQRKIWLWYARAAKVLDILEEMWIVWPSNWSKPREVYID